MATARRLGNPRLYATNDERWRKIRKAVLNDEPHCRQCRKEGKRVFATDVDHINNRADRPDDYARSNLQPLCASCHSKKTIIEQHAQKGTKARVRVGCDRDGFPADHNANAVQNERIVIESKG